MVWIFQILRGVFIVFRYNNNYESSFEALVRMGRVVEFGEEVRLIHSIVVNLLFLFIFIHMFRSLFFINRKNISI